MMKAFQLLILLQVSQYPVLLIDVYEYIERLPTVGSFEQLQTIINASRDPYGQQCLTIFAMQETISKMTEMIVKLEESLLYLESEGTFTSFKETIKRQDEEILYLKSKGTCKL